MALGKLDKDDRKAFGEYSTQLHRVLEALQNLVEPKQVHDRVEANSLTSQLAEALERANAEVDSAHSFIDELTSAQQDLFDEKSEKWQEGEKGEAVQGWLDELRELDEPEALEGELQVNMMGTDVRLADVKLQDDVLFPTEVAVVVTGLYELEKFIEAFDNLRMGSEE